MLEKERMMATWENKCINLIGGCQTNTEIIRTLQTFSGMF
jgi:hypothetical protein